MTDDRATLLARIEALEKENVALLLQLEKHGIVRHRTEELTEQQATSADEPDIDQQAIMQPVITRTSPLSDKIALFMSLFHGRTDVYARQWRKDEKIGYSPVCANRWNPSVCKKPNMKCADCPNTAYQLFTEQVTMNHLTGKQVIGIYTILPGDLCHFLAIDFDEADWKQDVAALRKVCASEHVPCSVEISRSGNGAHVWFFFEQAENAAQARRFGTRLLDLAMQSRAKLSFASYDRMFPNQDTMPKGGIGNLIALPLQREAAQTTGGSLFVDEGFVPYPDQWVYLSGMQRVPHETVMNTASHAPDRTADDALPKPWIAKETLTFADFGDSITATIADRLYISMSGISQKTLAALKRLAAFRNPSFYKQQAMRMPIWNIPRTICCAEFEGDYLCLPRGCAEQVQELCDSFGCQFVFEDERQHGRMIDVCFNGELREEQRPALDALVAHENGILSATTAFGKTVIGAALIAEKKVNTLVLVNRTQLVLQWKERLGQFLIINEELPEQPKKRGRKKQREIIGQYGAGKDTRSGIVDVAVMQSMGKPDEIPAWVREYGMVIVDECHHVPAFTFEQVLKAIPARYTYGLTATPKRSDGHQPILNMYLGPVRYQVDALSQALLRPFSHLMIPRFTGAVYKADEGNRISLTGLYQQMMDDDIRNGMIIDDISACIADGRNCLVLSERTAHIQKLVRQLEGKTPNLFLMLGSASPADKKKQLDALQHASSDAPLVICATGKYIGEGFDESRLDTLFLTMPISWEGTLAQYVGRLHRRYEGKQEVRVYDYIDNNTEILARMYNKRLKGYAAIGYQAAAVATGDASQNMIFNNDSYLDSFVLDLCAAEKSAVIASPYIAGSMVHRLRQHIAEAIQRRVSVMVLCRHPDSFSEQTQASMLKALDELASLGVNVRYMDEAYRRYAVFDDRIVWYGGINLLGGSGEESMLRIVSGQVARAIGQ